MQNLPHAVRHFPNQITLNSPIGEFYDVLQTVIPKSIILF